MSSRHSQTRTGGDAEQPSLPPADPPPLCPPPPPPKDAERDGRGNHHVEEPNDGPEPNAGRGAGKVNQEAVTAAVLNTLSNPEVIRRMLAVVSPEGPAGSASLRTASRTDGELIQQGPKCLYFTMGHEPSVCNRFSCVPPGCRSIPTRRHARRSGVGLSTAASHSGRRGSPHCCRWLGIISYWGRPV